MDEVSAHLSDGALLATPGQLKEANLRLIAIDLRIADAREYAIAAYCRDAATTKPLTSRALAASKCCRHPLLVTTAGVAVGVGFGLGVGAGAGA